MKFIPIYCRSCLNVTQTWLVSWIVAPISMEEMCHSQWAFLILFWQWARALLYVQYSDLLMNYKIFVRRSYKDIMSRNIQRICCYFKVNAPFCLICWLKLTIQPCSLRCKISSENFFKLLLLHLGLVGLQLTPLDLRQMLSWTAWHISHVFQGLEGGVVIKQTEWELLQRWYATKKLEGTQHSYQGSSFSIVHMVWDV